MALEFHFRENARARDLTAAIEAAAPGEGLWWVLVQHRPDIIAGLTEPPRDLAVLVAELRRLKGGA